ncbi:hypothetical protein [Pseudaminobacter sp. NGMCC 1.201702]
MSEISEDRVREIIREELSKLMPPALAEIERKLPDMLDRLKARSM